MGGGGRGEGSVRLGEAGEGTLGVEGWVGGGLTCLTLGCLSGVGT